MPGSPEAYVQEAGRAGRDGKPARCVLLFQPDDIAIQEHFLKEAHPTKAQARMVADGLYAWSDEGKEVSVRDLAVSMALPERRVRVVLSVLEAMGVAVEVKAARWKGVEPRPTREDIHRVASVFEARRISDRRRLSDLLKYMNTQACRVQMMREYFGEPTGERCGLCDSCAGLDSEVFDPGAADQRHDLHAATDFHARARRRKKKEKEERAPHPGPQAPAPMVFATAIPEILAPLVRAPVADAPPSEAVYDETSWAAGDPLVAGADLPGEVVVEGDDRAWLNLPSDVVEGGASGEDAEFEGGWAAVRDSNIRPYHEWMASKPFSLPAMVARPQPGPREGQGPASPQRQGRDGRPGPHHPGGGGGGDRGGDFRHGRRRKRRGGRDRAEGSARQHDRDRHRQRERGPRLPGVYNPGGD
jgi:hypothetical protein